MKRRKDGKIHNDTLYSEGKKNQATSRTTPAYSMTILTSDEGGEDFKDKDFNYRQVIGKLLYLEKSTRPVEHVLFINVPGIAFPQRSHMHRL